MKRIVQPEILDSLSPHHPDAQRSRRDLRRVNFWMRNHSIMALVLKNNLDGHTVKKITELGAGDGTFLLRVAQKLHRPNVHAVLVDLQKNVVPETLGHFQKINWQAQPIVSDVFGWLDRDDCTSENIISNLFLHHFEDASLGLLLKKIAARTRFFVAIEPRRFKSATACAQLLRLIGCGRVTLHDAAASIRAGFGQREISALWPEPGWQLVEQSAGLFSHLFIARKIS